MMVTSLGIIDHALVGPDGIFTDESKDRFVTSNSRQGLLTNVTYYRESGVKPRMETFGTVGPFRNLQWLVKQKGVDPPYCLTWNFGMPGIIGDPATPFYFYERIAAQPPDLKADINGEISVYQPGPSRLHLHSLAISEGYHVRIGMEDMPYDWTDIPSKDNRELVGRCVRLAKEFHREVADSSEARKMYKLPKLSR